MIYLFQNGKVVEMKEIIDFKEGESYFLLTEIDELPAIHRSVIRIEAIEEFYVKLKTDEDITNQQVGIAKDVVSKEGKLSILNFKGITFIQLMNTGDLAITDAELKEYGISQGGIRKAILSVIRSNQ
jgi:hypothetical protein